MIELNDVIQEVIVLDRYYGPEYLTRVKQEAEYSVTSEMPLHSTLSLVYEYWGNNNPQGFIYKFTGYRFDYVSRRQAGVAFSDGEFIPIKDERIMQAIAEMLPKEGDND